jgi:general secretion pathway protein D
MQIFALPVFSQNQSPLIYSVKVKEVNGQIKVYVKASDKIDYKVKMMKDPYLCLYLDAYPAQLSKDAKIDYDVKKGIAKSIKVRQFSDNPDVVRIAVYLDSETKYEVYTSKDKRALSFTIENPAVKPVAKAETVATAEKQEDTKAVKKAENNSPEKNTGVKTETAKNEKPVATVQKENTASVKAASETKVKTTPEKQEQQTKETVSAPKAVKKTSSVEAPKKKAVKPVAKANTVKPAPKKTAQKKPEPKKVKPQVKKSKPAPKEKTLDLVYDNEDISFVLRDLADKYNKNIVFRDQITGKVTVDLRNVTLARALQIFLGMTGYSCKVLGNIYIVDSQENLNNLTDASLLRGGDQIVEVVTLKYQKPSAIIEKIKASAPDAQVTENQRLNAVVLTGPSELVSYLKHLVLQYDQIPPETSVASVKTEMIRLSYCPLKDAVDLINTWYPGIDLLQDERLNGIILNGPPDSIDTVKSFVGKIDKPKKQVELDVKIVDLTELGAKSLGVNWSPNILSTTLNEVVPTGAAWQTGQAAYQTPTYTGLPIQTFARSPLTYDVGVSYLVSKSQAKVLASPKVLTMSGEKATFSVGEQYPMVYYDPRAGDAQAETINIAIKIDVKPTVTSDGFIMTEITPEISEMATSIVDTRYPQTTQRKVTTNVILKDGQTFLLGGLYRTEKSNNNSRIPLLGDIPILKNFFQNNSDSSGKDELVIMVTPRIIEDVGGEK